MALLFDIKRYAIHLIGAVGPGVSETGYFM